MVECSAVRIDLPDPDRAELVSRMRRSRVGRADATRAELVSLAAAGIRDRVIIGGLNNTHVTVATLGRTLLGQTAARVVRRILRRH